MDNHILALSELQQPATRKPVQKSIDRPGPTSKSVIAKPRKVQSKKSRKEVHRSYTREFKLQVLSYFHNHQIPISPTLYRPPTETEVWAHFLLPRRTLRDWINPGAMDAIVNAPKGTRTSGSTKGKWPEMEEELYASYRVHRDEGKAVRRAWFRRKAEKCFRSSYPLSATTFTFTNGWFSGFLSRYRISLRFPTNISQQLPADYVNPCLNFVRFARRNAQLRSGDEMLVVGRYLLSSICNMDETPLPFEFLDGQTYADRGSHTVQVRSTKSGWNKRQATVILCVFADGAMRVKPLLLFKGAEVLTRTHDQQRRASEIARYDPRIAVYFNPNAYANETVLLHWINNLLVPALPVSRPSMLALDVAKFHKTDTILNALRSHDIIPAMIPPGCTGLVQPLDVSINKPLKDILRNLIEDAMELFEQQTGDDLYESQKGSAMEERRVLIQHCLAQAWHTFCTTRHEVIVSSFRKLGLSLPIDGSCDSELSIKGFSPEQLVIGDWRVADRTFSPEVNTEINPNNTSEDILDQAALSGPELDYLAPENDDKDEFEFVDRD